MRPIAAARQGREVEESGERCGAPRARGGSGASLGPAFHAVASDLLALRSPRSSRGQQDDGEHNHAGENDYLFHDLCS